MISYFSTIIRGIGQSWIESLKLFLPDNFSKLFLVTIKTTRDSYYYLFTYFGWAILLEAIIEYSDMGGLISFLFQLTGILLRALIFFGILCAIRPTIEQKKISYFLNKIKNYFLLYLIGAFLLQGILFLTLIYLFVSQKQYDFHASYSTWILDYMVNFILIFYTLFLIDNRLSFGAIIYAIIRSLKMLVYNLPFCGIVAVIMGFIYTFLNTRIHYSVLQIVILPFFIALVTNFYIKRVHEQFKVYYDTP